MKEERIDSKYYEDLCEVWKKANQLQGMNLNPLVVLYRAAVQMFERGESPRLPHKEEQEEVAIKQEEEQFTLTAACAEAEDGELPLLLYNAQERNGYIRALTYHKSDPPKKTMDCEDSIKESSAACSTAPSLEDSADLSGLLTSSSTKHSENTHTEHQSGRVDIKKGHEMSYQIHLKSNRGAKRNPADNNESVRDEAMEEEHASLQCSKRDDPKKVPFRCTECGATFTFKQNLSRHIKLHTEGKPFSCTHCERRFAEKYRLNSHMSACHPERFPHSCAVCKKGYSSTKALESHMPSHAEKHLCSECGKSFTSKKNLKAHVRIHTGDYSLNCSVCNKGFVGAHHLKIHMRTHTGERPFSCAECGSEFRQAKHYRVHVRIHSGERPFSCAVCNRSFSRPNHVTSHMKVHQTKKPFSCKVCYKEFAQKYTYNQHMKVHYLQEKYGVTSRFK